MRQNIILLCSITAVLMITGCKESALNGDSLILVDFKLDAPVKYRLVSERDFTVDLDSNSDKARSDKMSEKLEMVISYKPVGEYDPYGVSTIEATCHSAKVTRKMKNRTPKDVVESLTGKTYTFKVTPTGKIVDFSNMSDIAAELGANTMVDSGRQGRIKNPDMIADFVTLQWYLWDSISTSGQTVDGLVPGQTWSAKQFIPLPVPVGFTRETTYVFEPDKAASGDGRAADKSQDQALKEAETVTIKSTFAPGEGKLENWPRIYTGSFNMRGTMGVLRNFSLKSIEGSGEQIFNIKKGVIEKDTLQYKVEVAAVFLLPLAGTSPLMTVNQKMSIELLED